MRPVHIEPKFSSWRDQARPLLLNQVSPDQILWLDREPSLFANLDATEESEPAAELANSAISKTKLLLPAEFIRRAKLAACVNDPRRWDVLYRLAYRLLNGEKQLLSLAVDPDVVLLDSFNKQVHRDIHKMHAFVRFRRLRDEERYIAWYEPKHFIVEEATPFFARRFGDKPWSILTPMACAHWDLEKLFFTEGLAAKDAADENDWEDLWQTYYSNIFNPARLNLKLMKASMPVHFWENLPEAQIIGKLVQEVPERYEKMRKAHQQAAEVPVVETWQELKDASLACKACPLHANATQTVFGEGSLDAEIMIIGEQPGDQEDLAGHAFVGPAGEVLNRAMIDAGLDRKKVYVTNAVKHFKWKPSGKVRLHQKPSGAEMHACRPWLLAEIARVKPKVILALGATAGTSLLGRLPKVTEERGRWLESSLVPGAKVLLSWHPSAILRAMSEEDRDQKLKDLMSDIAMAHSALIPAQ